MNIDRNHPMAQHVLSLLSSNNGWSTKGLDFRHINHIQGYTVEVDRGWYRGELPPMVNISTTKGYLEFPVLVNRRFFGLSETINQSDPFVQGYERVLAYCQNEHLKGLPSY